MNLWLNQQGHPSLIIDYWNGTFNIAQNVQKGTNETFWPLPVFVQLNNNQKRLYWSAPNYQCENGKTLPTILKIKTSTLFINRDLLGVTGVHYSPEAIQAIVDTLTSFTTNFQLSPPSLSAFINDVIRSLKENGASKEHVKNVIENILIFQRNVFSLGPFAEFSKRIEDGLEEGAFNNAIPNIG